MDIARFNKEILARWRRSPDDDRLFVAHVTDIHMLNPDEDRPEVLRHYPSPEIEWCRESFIRVVDDIAELAVKPDLLLITGDLTSTGDPVAWAQVFAVMEKLKISFLVCLGNHENGNQTEPTAEFQTIMTTLRGYGCPASLLRDLWTYRTTFGGYQFVILDSLLNGDLGTDQHDVLRESLAADIPTVILLHRPVICTDHPLDRLRLFDPVFEDIVAGSENVTAVLSGHIHRPAAKRHRGQMHFVGAATCFGNNCPTGYRLMCLAGGQVAWAVTRIVPGPSCKAYQGPIVHQDGGAAWEVLDGGLQRWMRVEPRAGKPAGRHECSLSEAAAHNGLCAIRGARETLMDSRQRVVKAIHFGGPDCPPISHAILPSAQYHYGKALAGILETVHEDFGWQFLPDLPRGELPPMYRMGTNVDSFGTVWKVTEEGRCGIPVEFPLKDYARHDGYVWPEFGAGTPKYRLYSGHMEGTSTEYYARGGWIVFFEQLQQLRGIESLLEDLMDEPRELFRLRDDMLKFNLRWIDRWLEHEYQGLHFADDWGTQKNLMVPPRIWRSFFKPAYAEMFDKVKSAGLDVWFHSDGDITEILPDLVELGVDVLNCQVSLMDRDRIGSRFAGKICFRTDLDRQKVMPYASPAEVKEYIFGLFDVLGTRDGGIIACGEISEDIPLANIRAMYEAFMEYRH